MSLRRQQLDELRTHLLQKQGMLDTLARSAKDEDLDILEGERADEIDLASAETLQGFALRLRSREARLSNKIRMAIERMNSGAFGICEICDEPIGIARLRARPETTLCIDCKEDQERNEANYEH